MKNTWFEHTQVSETLCNLLTDLSELCLYLLEHCLIIMEMWHSNGRGFHKYVSFFSYHTVALGDVLWKDFGLIKHCGHNFQ